MQEDIYNIYEQLEYYKDPFNIGEVSQILQNIIFLQVLLS